MKQISIALVAFTVAFINFNLNFAGAQPPNTSTSTSSTDPDLLTCRERFSRSELCSSTTPPRVRRPPQPQWYVVVNGNLEGSRQHGEVETDLGHTEYGIGGTIDCHEAETGNVAVVIAPSSLRYLQGETGHRFVAGTICLPLGSTGPVNIDLSNYVTLQMFNLLVARVEDLERRVGEHDNMLVGINDDIEEHDGRLDRIEDRLDNMPPPVAAETNRMHYRLRLGGQFMVGSSVDSTLMTAGLATLGAEFFSANNRHGLVLRGEIGSSNMRGTEGNAPIRRATLFGGSVAYGFRPLNWATISLGGRVLGVSDHNGNPDVYHGYRGTLAGPELALTLDRQIQDGPFGVYFRVSASFLRGQVNYWINSEEIQAGRSSVNLGLEGGFTFGR